MIYKAPTSIKNQGEFNFILFNLSYLNAVRKQPVDYDILNSRATNIYSPLVHACLWQAKLEPGQADKSNTVQSWSASLSRQRWKHSTHRLSASTCTTGLLGATDLVQRRSSCGWADVLDFVSEERCKIISFSLRCSSFTKYAECSPQFVIGVCVCALACNIQLEFVTLPSSVVISLPVIFRVSHNSWRQSNATVESVAKRTRRRRPAVHAGDVVRLRTLRLC